MEHKNYETALPEGYREALTVDAKNKKTSALLTLASILITAAALVLSILIIRPKDFLSNFNLVKYFITLAALPAYVVLHELTHGAAYKLLTHQKLTFGLTLTVAFCGVPQIYVYRRTALISLLAPFTVFTIIFGGAVLLLPEAWDKVYAAALLSLHLGGCLGDLYDTFLYLTRFREPRTLMRDTGPTQVFLCRKNKGACGAGDR